MRIAAGFAPLCSAVANPRFAGTFQLDRPAVESAFFSQEHAGLSELDPELADRFAPRAAEDKAALYLAGLESKLAPIRQQVAEELDTSVTVRFYSSHIQQPWGDGARNFIGDNVEISRADEPDTEPVHLPRHMGQSYESFWPAVMQAAKAFNRPPS